MAIINCPECGREISDAAAACPHCGFPITKRIDTVHAAAPVSQAIRRTKLGEPEKKSSFVPIATGTMMLLFGLPALIFILPVGGLMIAAAIFCFVMAGKFTKGYRKAKCPYCEKDVEVFADAETHKCQYCQKVSTVKDGYLVTIE